MTTGSQYNNGHDVVRLEIPATLRHLNIVGACLTATCERLTPRPSAGTVQAAELALQEACTNIVNHAYDASTAARGSIVLELTVQGHDLVVDLFDTGTGFDPKSVAAPDLENPHEHGYGVFLIRQLMDSVEYARHNGRNRLRMRKMLAG